MLETLPLTLDDGPELVPAIERVIAKNPDHLKAKAGLAFAWLSQGKLAPGWRQYQYQMLIDHRIYYDDFPVKRWDGEPLDGKHVLVWLDRGVGDQVFAAGMLGDLVDIAASVTVLCTRRLANILRRSFPTITVYRSGEPLPHRMREWNFDCQMAFADLGAAFRPILPRESKPFLTADSAKTAEFRKRYATDSRCIVGLSWWSQNCKTGTGKSMALSHLRHVLRREDTKFVCLQYGSVADEVAYARREYGIDIEIDETFNQLTDLDSFAAQVAAMDGVLTASNSTAHFAGALGIPGIVMLPRGLSRFWYWHDERSDSPWYPCLRLVRQDIPGDWESVMRQIPPLLDDVNRREVDCSYIAPAEDPRDVRIRKLEDALSEFAGLAVANDINMEMQVDDPAAKERLRIETKYLEINAFYRAAELTRGFR